MPRYLIDQEGNIVGRADATIDKAQLPEGWAAVDSEERGPVKYDKGKKKVLRHDPIASAPSPASTPSPASPVTDDNDSKVLLWAIDNLDNPRVQTASVQYLLSGSDRQYLNTLRSLKQSDDKQPVDPTPVDQPSVEQPPDGQQPADKPPKGKRTGAK